MQPDLFTARPPVTSREVEALIAYLFGRGWCRAKSMADRWSDRQLRELANQSKGRVISGQRGYCLIDEATTEEANHAANWLEAQSRAMHKRSVEIRQAMHRRWEAVA